jgi:hypothetical protein
MQISLERLRNHFRHEEVVPPLPEIKPNSEPGTNVQPEPVFRQVVPAIFRVQRIVTSHEPLYREFCRDCNAEPMLLGVKGNLALLDCDRNGCRKLFRINTATNT